MGYRDGMDRIDVFHHFDAQHPLSLRIDAEEIHWKLDTIIARLNRIERKEQTIMAELDTLTAQVQANTDVENSALVLINGIAARIAAAGADPVALKKLSDSLKTSADALAAAVVANTPDAPAGFKAK